MDRLLEPLGDRQIPRLDHVAAVGLGVRFAADDKILDLTTDEILKPSQIALVEIEIARPAKQLL